MPEAAGMQKGTMAEVLNLGGLVVYSDGSFVRGPGGPTQPANPNPADGVATQDVTFDEQLNLWVRIYCEKSVSESTKLPVVIFFHGGGFALLNADSVEFQKLCEGVCRSGVVVVSVNYRLAPEHRLPAAYEDGLAALKWLQCVAKGEKEAPWLTSYADFSKVFSMGDSAGGNLAHYVARKAGVQDLEPLNFVGQILLQPFFGGTERTESETKLGSSELIENLWNVVLPIGASRDHPFCNPVAALRQGEGVEEMKKMRSKVFVMVGRLDALQDRGVQFAKLMEEHGKDVQMVTFEKAGHAFYVRDCDETNQLLGNISEFIGRCII